MDDEWSDAHLIDYIEIHSHTELALVSNAHVRRFLALAGHEMPQHLAHKAFIGCHYHDIKNLLESARKNIREALPQASDVRDNHLTNSNSDKTSTSEAVNAAEPHPTRTPY